MKGFAAKLLISGLVLVLFASAGCLEPLDTSADGENIMLWNGKDFTGWKLFIPDKGIDVNDVWSVRDGVIYCTGKPNGYMRTEAKYENYYLHVEWRWPDTPTNSGVLLHANGPDNTWPRSIECQLQASNAGDFVLIYGTDMVIDGKNQKNPDRQFTIITKKEESSEKPAGQWNTYDIYCRKDSIQCYVNGILQNEGTSVSETSGWICLQSEGSPIEFRNIYLVSYEDLEK